MKSMNWSLNIPAVVLLVASLCLIGYQAGATRAAAPSPTVIATLNLTRVFADLNERAQAEIRLQELADRLRADAERQQADLERMVDEANEIEDPDEQLDKIDLIRRDDIAFQAWAVLNEKKVDFEKALLYQSLYRAIKDAAAELAETEGYDMVLIDDSLGELVINRNAKIPQSIQIQQQISARRMLYAAETIDITDALIQRMNNAFNVQGGG